MRKSHVTLSPTADGKTPSGAVTSGIARNPPPAWFGFGFGFGFGLALGSGFGFGFGSGLGCSG